MSIGQGANMALPIWADYMKKLYHDKYLMYHEKLVFRRPKEFQYSCDRLKKLDKKNNSNANDQEKGSGITQEKNQTVPSHPKKGSGTTQKKNQTVPSHPKKRARIKPSYSLKSSKQRTVN
ncbi:hypothetical protein [Blattabacterium cuenoti]|uniref:hypothetical protein n=1 Tax=Blattabacterium cuenoti TaxID=1653831 RepID=UPI00163D2DBE|nr:hypothetical protein [Blattabacterium cuenoti]